MPYGQQCAKLSNLILLSLNKELYPIQLFVAIIFTFPEMIKISNIKCLNNLQNIYKQ